MLESIQSLRRHYPDQVRGYVLSLFTLPQQGRHPFVIRRQKYCFFRNADKKVLFLLTKQRHTRCRLIDLDIIGWIHG